jgi:hypothetical protein
LSCNIWSFQEEFVHFVLNAEIFCCTFVLRFMAYPDCSVFKHPQRCKLNFMYLDCYFMLQSLIIFNTIPFDHHFTPYNLGWYASVLILYVFSISKLACTFFGYVKFLIVFHFYALYILCLLYILYEFLTCSISFGLWPHVLGFNE